MIKENRDKIISNLTILSNWNLSCCIRQGGTNSVMADDNYHSQLTNSNIPNWCRIIPLAPSKYGRVVSLSC